MTTPTTTPTSTKEFLTDLAKQVLRSRGLQPDFTNGVLKQLEQINSPSPPYGKYEDLRHLLWCSIDNDDSKDLDQLTYGEKNADGNTTIWIAVADVDALLKKDSAIDINAQTNTTSIYTPATIFPMLPVKLSTNLTSLNENVERMAMVVKIVLDNKGNFLDSSIFHALVFNHAQLAYNATGAWLEGSHTIPDKIKKLKGLETTLRLQHQAAQILRLKREAMGSLTLESPQVVAKVNEKDEIILEVSNTNAAHQLIEEFMVAANYVMATQLRTLKIASLRRIVRKPIKWNRIVELANSLGEPLPNEPDSKALDEFLVKRKEIDPIGFPDLSLTVIKLMGRGEYIVENVGDIPIGHFGLALSNYTHSTAPNRRYPDIITQRQYKAYLANETPPYSHEELNKLAARCTEQEDAASRAERQLNKSAAAILLEPLIGTKFKGIITGVSPTATWIRIFKPPVEGKLIKGFEKLDVGDRVTATLVSVDIPQGFIDFEA
jgi:exoribonuclease-2